MYGVWCVDMCECEDLAKQIRYYKEIQAHCAQTALARLGSFLLPDLVDAKPGPYCINHLVLMNAGKIERAFSASLA